ncbi:MAG: carbohydrate ABC transporter permease [Nitrospinota bacterium]|nr:MAG: carbohydrate ABC transporter permease [Nitrospinota bacterium]
MAVRRGGRFRHFVKDHIGVVPFLFFALFPVYFMFITALKKNKELYNLDAVPFLIREGVTFQHFLYVYTKTNFFIWLKNSVVVSVTATAIALPISILAAYSLARIPFKGAATFGTTIFITYLVPPTLLFLPLTRVVNFLGLADSIWALIVTYPTFLIPFSTWLLIGYFRTVPREIEECAMVDGCSRLGTLFRIVLPVSIPGLICVLLFSFTLSWNEFIYALTFISSSPSKTVTVGTAAELIRGDVFNWGAIMAGAFTGALPIVIIYVFFLDYYVAGLTAGAVK